MDLKQMDFSNFKRISKNAKYNSRAAEWDCPLAIVHKCSINNPCSKEFRKVYWETFVQEPFTAAHVFSCALCEFSKKAFL